MFEAVVAPPRHLVRGGRATLGSAVLVAGLIGASPAAASLTAPGQADVALTAVGTDLSTSGIALIMGPSMIPTPGEQFADAVNELFLQPHGFAGALEVLTTPASPYQLDNSLAAGTEIVVDRVQSLIESGDVDADHPVTIFGYSQSAAMTTWVMRDLDEAGVPSDYVHFVLIGDSVNPLGGALVALDGLPGIDLASDIPMGNPTPNDLYPTDIYSLEYDGYADFPLYPYNLLSTLNALMGMVTQHLAYLGLTADDITGATLLESSPDSMINSYMIESEYLPLLIPLLFTPIIGQPLYDLLEPTARILVNMGYGNLDHGWNDGPADVAQTASTILPNIDSGELSAALAQAAQQGWDAFSADLFDPATYTYTDVMDLPVLAGLVTAAETAVGATDDSSMTLQQLTEAVFNMVWPSLSGEGMILD